MDVLLLRLDAPLMSFGAPMVDQNGVIQAFPALSLITGLFGNALGYHHRDHVLLQSLQERIQYAVRQDQPGERIQDYQTVDLGQDHLLQDRGWTTRGTLDGRAGANSTETHIRFRDYWAGAIYTVALTLLPAEASPTMDALEQALLKPERPLFIGRKTCLPATPILLGRNRDAEDLLDALRNAPLPKSVLPRPTMRAWWPSIPGQDEFRIEKRPVTDARDWQNQIHVGQRWIASGPLTMPMEETS